MQDQHFQAFIKRLNYIGFVEPKAEALLNNAC